jgi:hypothetical protein
MHRFSRSVIVAATAVFGASLAQSLQAAPITGADIVAIPNNAVGSGNGTLDLRLFTFSGAEIPNTSGAFNGDNANHDATQGGGADTNSFAQSYVTTAGDLKAFYNLNFAPGTINEVVLFLDPNETGAGTVNNTLAKLDVVLNPTTIQGNPNPAGDVTSVQQGNILQVYTGGVLIANLNPEPAANLPVNNQGAGFADYAIHLGVNPFALADSDVLLFNVSMNTLNNGAEELFLSGTYRDEGGEVPEPVGLTVLGCAMLPLMLKRRREV